MDVITAPANENEKKHAQNSCRMHLKPQMVQKPAEADFYVLINASKPMGLNGSKVSIGIRLQPKDPSQG